MRTRTSQNELLSLAEKLADMGALSNPVEHESGVIIVEKVESWRVVAQYASMLCGGTWEDYPTGAFNNRKSLGGWIVDGESSERIESARRVHKNLTGEECGYSVGSAARGILKWAVKPDDYLSTCDVTRKDAGIQYHECAPGRYKDMVMLDLKGAYFQGLSRLKSWRWHATGNGDFLPQRLDKIEQKRQILALESIAPNKHLRNAVWGSMVGSLNPKRYFHGGYEKWRRPYPGKYQAAGNLVARCVWELTLAACYDTSAVYSQVDCVICPSGATPKTWHNHNFEYKQLAHGDAHIQQQHGYRIGGKYTQWYDKNSKFQEPTERALLPNRFYVNEVLYDTPLIEIDW